MMNYFQATPITTYVIAESGSCPEGDVQRYRDMIALAHRAGANAFKAQWTSSPEWLAAQRGVPDPAVYRWLAWPAEWHARLAKVCQACGLDYLCTVYLPEDIAVVAPHVAQFKIASPEAGDRAFLEAHRPYGKPILVSTGALTPLQAAWLPGWVQRLYCVSRYPAPPESLALDTIRAYGYDGFSDHTGLELTGALAVMAGARIVEVHMRLETTRPDNPDFPHALRPEALRAYLRNIRLAERMR